MGETFRAGAAADRTIVSGASLGGLAASFAGFQHPEVFGNVLSQSGSYWWTPASDSEPEWLMRQFAAASRRGIRLSISVGAMEVAQQLDTNRRLRDVLVARGYALDYTEFNGNHSYLNWRAEFADRIAQLIGPAR
jgi:enterochelin esterase-like enzyme